MIVTGYERTCRNVEIEVNPLDVLKQIKYETFAKLGIKHDAYLNSEGQLVYDDEFYGSHYSCDEKVIDKNPSKEIKDTIKAFDRIISLIIDNKR